MKNIVFDVGMVLVNFRWHDYMKDLGFPEDRIQELAENMVFSEYWHELDLGTKREEDAPAYFIGKMPQYEKEIRLFWQRIDEIALEYPYDKPMIRALKEQGYRVYLLSNYPLHMAEVHWSRFSFLQDLDGYIISAREGVTKPDPAIYRILETRYGLDLRECLFIDDRKENTDAAVNLHMDGYVFTGYDGLRDFLRNKYGIRIPEA